MMHRMAMTLGLTMAATTMAMAGEISGQLSRTPWSGTFWPLRKCWASFGNRGQGLAPFEKYDNYVSLTRGANPGTAAREADPANGHNEAPDRSRENWTGHCHGWAPASLLEPEPPDEVTIRLDQPSYLLQLTTDDPAGVKAGFSTKRDAAYTFRATAEKALELSTPDMKAMLTEVYCESRSNFWGTRYNGRQPDRNDPAYMDVKPNLFHQLLVQYIKEKDQGLVIDADPGYMVWNQPVYRFESRWTEDDKQMSVTTTIWWANDNGVDPAFRGTDSVQRTYTYVLTKDAAGAIVGGQWTGASVDDHPDFVWLPYGVVDEANVAGLDLDVVHEMIAANGRTVSVKNPGRSGDGAGGQPGDGSRDERRRNLWDRMRDGLHHLFGG